MNETTLSLFRAKLEKIRFTMTGDVEDRKGNLNEQVADTVDNAIQSYGRQLMMELGEQEWKKFRLVEEAIKKIDDGQYGLCIVCEEIIPESRLEVIPFVAYCIDCLEAIEKKNG